MLSRATTQTDVECCYSRLAGDIRCMWSLWLSSLMKPSKNTKDEIRDFHPNRGKVLGCVLNIGLPY